MTKGHKGHKGQMSDREVMKLALEALEFGLQADELPSGGKWDHMAHKAITALRTALEQPEQDMPCGWVNENGIFAKQLPNDFVYSWKPVYALPPKREWVWLTDEEIVVCGGMDGADNWVFEFANALQIKLREKNHG